MNKTIFIGFVIGAIAFALLLVSKRTSAAGVDRIKQFEALRLAPYKDAAGKWTIGYGHLIKPGESYLMSTRITPEKAGSLLRSDLATAEGAIRSVVKVPLSGSQFDALVSLVFNIGTGAFSRSTLLVLLNQGDYAGAAAQFPRWTKAGGRQLVGLVARRAGEQNLFLA